MRLTNKEKDFNSKDFIEFTRRGPKSAEEKRNIKKGLKKFWDKKGRAVMTVGAGALGTAGAITLAAKSGKIPTGKSMTNVGQKLLSGKSKQNLLPPASGVNSNPRLLPGAPTKTNAAMTVPGVSSDNIVSQVAKTTGKMGGRAYGTGKATRAAVAEGYKNAKPSDTEYKVGAGAARLIKAIVRKTKRG